MNHWFFPLNILGSAVLVAFGLYVWRVEPGNPRNQAFCLFAVGFSLGTALANVGFFLGFEGAVRSTSLAFRGLFYGIGGAGAMWFAYLTVKPGRRTLVRAGAVPFALLAVLAGALAAGVPIISPATLHPLSVVLEPMGFMVLLGGSLFGVLLFAMDFGRPDRDPELRRERAYLAAALVLYPGFYLTLNGADLAAASIEPGYEWPLAAGLLAVAHLGAALLLVAVWIPNTRIPEARSTARNLAWLAAVMGVVGAWLSLTDSLSLYGVPFLARTGAVGLLGYAILRHQLLDIDAKVEWGLSKTTVAGVFVAVFFIAGELAETFFGEVFGPYVGVVAAGALVFVISPLQRLADRFAAEAVPGGAPTGGARAEATYRRTVERYLADGALTAEEGHELGELAAELGIDPERAREVRTEATAESDGGEEA